MSPTDQQLFNSLFPNLISVNSTVIIFGHYRSGTTALTSLISLTKNITNFGELLEEDHYEDRIRAELQLKNKEFFTFNIKPRYYYRLPECFKESYVPNYKIKLTRKNVVNQLTSLCIQILDNRRGFDPKYPKPDYAVDIKMNDIKRTIYSYLEYVDLHDKINTTFDAEVYFEDILPLFKYSKIKISWKPLNYQELHEIVENEYNKIKNQWVELNHWVNRVGY